MNDWLDIVHKRHLSGISLGDSFEDTIVCSNNSNLRILNEIFNRIKLANKKGQRPKRQS